MIIEREHPSLLHPNDNDVVWRYISLEKFESLLERSSLFFCRANRFSDPFEGSIPKLVADYRIEDFKGASKFYQEDFNYTEAIKNVEALSKAHKKIKENTVINCWHMNEFESDGMWQLYLKSNEGVSIKSLVRNLIKAFELTNENILLSKVRYIDYENERWYHPIDYPDYRYNMLTPFVHKRIEFKHEAELRLFYEVTEAYDNEEYWSNQEFEKGVMIKADIDLLINEIVLPPTADKYIENKVSEILDKYGLQKDIRKSTLSTAPVY